MGKLTWELQYEIYRPYYQTQYLNLKELSGVLGVKSKRPTARDISILCRNSFCVKFHIHGRKYLTICPSTHQFQTHQKIQQQNTKTVLCELIIVELSWTFSIQPPGPPSCWNLWWMLNWIFIGISPGYQVCKQLTHFMPFSFALEHEWLGSGKQAAKFSKKVNHGYALNLQ